MVAQASAASLSPNFHLGNIVCTSPPPLLSAGREGGGGLEAPTKFLERAGLDTTLLFRGGLVGKRKNQENQEERFAGGVAIFTQKIT